MPDKNIRVPTNQRVFNKNIKVNEYLLDVVGLDFVKCNLIRFKNSPLY